MIEETVNEVVFFMTEQAHVVNNGEGNFLGRSTIMIYKGHATTTAIDESIAKFSNLLSLKLERVSATFKKSVDEMIGTGSPE